MKIEKNAPALPCMPMQDSLGRFFSPISGFTKYEYVVLEIYKNLVIQLDSGTSCKEDIDNAIEYANVYFKYLNELENEKNNISTIIQ
jgi:hypothetical protein